MIEVCIAGATGTVGRRIVEAIVRSDDIVLVGAIARASVGQDVGNYLLGEPNGVKISSAIEAAPAGQVFVDYSHSECAIRNARAALNAGMHAVVGTTGLDENQVNSLDELARSRRLGVIVCSNFSLTAILMSRFACAASRYLNQREIVEYAGAGKIDVPSGTAVALAKAISEADNSNEKSDVRQYQGDKEALGALISGVRVHSVRQAGFSHTCEVIFGADGERLIIRHDADASGQAYVEGTLAAIRQVHKVDGLCRSIDKLVRPN